jgi:rod shape-determining protein MreD
MVNKGALIKYIFGMLFIVFYQIVVAPRASILGAHTDMALILTVWVALDFGPREGILFGFTAGLLTGLLIPMELGWAALLLSIIGYIIGNIKNKLVIEPMIIKMLILLFALLAYNILYIFFTRFDLIILNIEFVLSNTIISTLNSTLIGIIIFLIIRYRYILRNLI